VVAAVSIQFGDVIAYLALGVSIVGLFIGEIRHRDNLRLVQRPFNMRAYELTYEFADFVGKYKTGYEPRVVISTRELVSNIKTFERALNLLGPVSIPGFVVLSKELQNKAWRLQRALDRWASEVAKEQALSLGVSIDSDNEAEASKICQWFHHQKPSIKELFKAHV
jgi:hypothetical protein